MFYRKKAFSNILGRFFLKKLPFFGLVGFWAHLKNLLAKQPVLGHFLFDLTFILAYANTALCAQNPKSLLGKIALRFYVFM